MNTPSYTFWNCIVLISSVLAKLFGVCLLLLFLWCLLFAMIMLEIIPYSVVYTAGNAVLNVMSYISMYRNVIAIAAIAILTFLAFHYYHRTD